MPNTIDFKITRPFLFLSQWRSLPWYELVSYVFMFASMPMLMYEVKPYNSSILSIILLTILSLYSGFFAVLIWNDITDADIDATVHPDRPIPSKRISRRKFFSIALFFSATTFIFSYLINLWCLLLVGFTALFVTIHNRYLKRIVKIPAYSEIFSPIQWIIVPIFGFFAVDGADFQNIILLVIFSYFAVNAHDMPEGIHDANGDREYGVRTYATSFGEANAARISFAMFFISGIFAIVLYFRTILTPIFLIPFLVIWLYALYNSYQFINTDNKKKELGMIYGRKGFNYFLAVFDLIFLDIFIQILIYNFFR